MRTLSSFVAAALLAVVCHGQSTCNLGQPLTSPNQGNVGGGIYFNMTVNNTVTWQSITYVAAGGAAPSPTPTCSLELYIGPSTWVNNVSSNPGPWLLVATTTPVPQLINADTTCVGVLNPAGVNNGTVTFGPGTYGIALRAVGHAWGYQNLATTFNAPGGAFSVSTGGASNAFLTLPSLSPRTINGAITFVTGGTPMHLARRDPYGAGCNRNFRSFYEHFPSTLFYDLYNTSVLLTLDAPNNRYVVSSGGSFVNLFVVTSPRLGHLDNQNLPVQLLGPPIVHPSASGVATTTTVEMCSNGYINLQGTVPATGGNPTVAQWLNGGATRIGTNRDLDPEFSPPGGGTFYDFDVQSSAHVFTWLSVPDFANGTQNNTFQIVFLPGGNVELRWNVMGLMGGGLVGCIVGFTTGNGAADPGSMDISASLPFTTSGFDQPPLALSAGSNPFLGTTVNLTTSNVTGTNLGLCFVSLASLPQSPTGLDLGFLGAPGCVANVDLNAAVGFVISNLGAPLPGLTVPLGIPAGPPAIVGQSFYCQSVWLDATQNALGLITSNAMRLIIG